MYSLRTYHISQVLITIDFFKKANNYNSMQIKVNNQQVELDNSVNLEQLLQILNQLEPGVALAVNRQIISRSQWSDHILYDGDDVTLIKATAGG